MKRNPLLAIAVGSILGAAIPQAYADDDPASTATSEENRDRASDQRDIARDQADIRTDQKDLERDQTDLRTDRQGLNRGNAAAKRAAAPQVSGTQHQQISSDVSRSADRDGMKDQRDIARDRTDIQADKADLKEDQADLRADRQDLRSDLRNHGQDDMRSNQDLRVNNNFNDRGVAGHRPIGEMLQGPRAQTVVDERNRFHDMHAAGSASRPDTARNWRQPGMSAADVAKNAGANTNRKPPTAAQHTRAWYHIWW